MKISIVIPVYNVEQYIHQCLASVASQTYDGELECIIVDDCGKDNSISLAEKFITDYQGNIRFSIVHHEHNGGLSAARNTGTRHATGDYVYYLDSDDEIPASCIQLLADVVANHPGVDIVQGGTLTVPVDDDFYSVKQYDKYPYVNSNQWIRKEFYRIKGGLPVNAWNKLIKTDFITINNLWFKEGIIHEDQHWMFFAVKHLQSIGFVQEVTYIHRRNNDSIMKASGKEKSERHWGIILREVTENLDNSGRALQVMKYTTAMIVRYSPTDDYEAVRQNLRNEMKTLGFDNGARLLSILGVCRFKLLKLFMFPVLRFLIRRYCTAISNHIID